ncbi:DUF4194 domain-containing protein [Humibacter sp. BT305]|nr:DUF4194 domain-containing protein [Humibacter sp. BT305]
MTDGLEPSGANPPLWTGDRGSLHDSSRRALLELLKGPYLSGARRPQLWAALIADEEAIRGRLHDLFLDLVVDPVDEFAFTRKVRTAERDVPSALRTESLTFIDTAMLLVLRQLLLASPGQPRVIVGQDEVFERLGPYRDGDESTYVRNLNGAWTRMKNRLRVIHPVGDDRAEISPVVKFIIDDDQIRMLTDVYERIAAGRSGRAAPVATTPGADPDDDEGMSA